MGMKMYAPTMRKSEMWVRRRVIDIEDTGRTRIFNYIKLSPIPSQLTYQWRVIIAGPTAEEHR